jgi:hypothetical protein
VGQPAGGLLLAAGLLTLALDAFVA